MARSSARNPRGDAMEAPGEDKRAEDPSAPRALACAPVRTRRAAPERRARGTRDAGVETSAEGIVAHRVVTCTRASELEDLICPSLGQSSRPVASVARDESGFEFEPAFLLGRYDRCTVKFVSWLRSRNEVPNEGARNATRTRHIAHLLSRASVLQRCPKTRPLEIRRTPPRRHGPAPRRRPRRIQG